MKMYKQLPPPESLSIVDVDAAPSSSTSRRTQERFVTHTHYTVPLELQAVIAGSDASVWKREDFGDIYWDYEDMHLTHENIWLRVRNGTDFAFKIVRDIDNALFYFEASGSLDVASEVRYAMERAILMASVTRFRHINTPHIWVDFVTFGDGDGTGQTIYDCVATVHGESGSVYDEPVLAQVVGQLGDRRRGAPLDALRIFERNVYDLLKSSTDKTMSPRDLTMTKPAHWPVAAPVVAPSKEVVEFYMTVLEDEYDEHIE